MVAGWTSYTSANNVWGLVFMPDATLWAATVGGAVRWDLTTDTYTLYTAADGLATTRATDVALASDGALWFATGGGLSRFDGTTWTTYTEADGLSSNVVNTVDVTGDGIIWAAISGGISRFDGTTWTTHTMNDGLADDWVWDVTVAPSGKVWCATHSGGISRYDPAQDAWTTYTTEHGLPSNHIRVVGVGPEGDVWVYVAYQGVYRFDSAVWQQVYEANGQWVCDFAFSPDGTPWIGTCNGYHMYGVGLVHRDGHTWPRTTIKQGLSSNNVTAVALGPEDLIAAGTDWGLNVYQRGEWRTLQGGLLDDMVQAIAVTPDGAAWFGGYEFLYATRRWPEPF